MSVAEQLDLRDETSGLLALADQRWGGWAISRPHLSHCCGVRELRSWLRGADKVEADDALHALATLAATDGGDDIAAVATLAWALMPGHAPSPTGCGPPPGTSTRSSPPSCGSRSGRSRGSACERSQPTC